MIKYELPGLIMLSGQDTLGDQGDCALTGSTNINNPCAAGTNAEGACSNGPGNLGGACNSGTYAQHTCSEGASNQTAPCANGEWANKDESACNSGSGNAISNNCGSGQFVANT